MEFRTFVVAGLVLVMLAMPMFVAGCNSCPWGGQSAGAGTYPYYGEDYDDDYDDDNDGHIDYRYERERDLDYYY